MAASVLFFLCIGQSKIATAQCMAAALVSHVQWLCVLDPSDLARRLEWFPHVAHAATIVDTVGSAALATQVQNAGVSLHISVDYVSRSGPIWFLRLSPTALPSTLVLHTQFWMTSG